MVIRYIKKHEFECKCGCGTLNVSATLLCMLEEAYNRCKVSFKIFSGCRCVKHNKDEGGKEDSEHIASELRMCKGADLQIANSWERFKLVEALIAVGFKRIGINRTTIHVGIEDKKPQEVMWHYYS